MGIRAAIGRLVWTELTPSIGPKSLCREVGRHLDGHRQGPPMGMAVYFTNHNDQLGKYALAELGRAELAYFGPSDNDPCRALRASG